jgi:hypothetical protein
MNVHVRETVQRDIGVKPRDVVRKRLEGDDLALWSDGKSELHGVVSDVRTDVHRDSSRRGKTAERQRFRILEAAQEQYLDSNRFAILEVNFTSGWQASPECVRLRREQRPDDGLVEAIFAFLERNMRKIEPHRQEKREEGSKESSPNHRCQIWLAFGNSSRDHWGIESGNGIVVQFRA